MEQDEITRRNVAIAEYMLYPYPITPEFHSNWHSLMPVVEKIINESLLGFHFFPPLERRRFVCRFGIGGNLVGNTMIEATWLAVSEYVLSLK